VRGIILAVDDGGRGDGEARRLLAHAEQLFGESGAAFYEPRLVQLRSRLERPG
jgi:adenylate cyclase